MKTTIISIPPCASSNVLKSLYHNNITCKYSGLDQKGRIVMELKSKENQEKLIGELIHYMEKSEQIMKEITLDINKTFKILSEENFKELDEIIKERKLKSQSKKSI